MNSVKIFLAGSVKKTFSELDVKKEYWKQKDEQYLKRNLDFPLELFNPNSLSISEFDSEKRFVSDLTELLSSSFIILDARNRKSIGVGSELMLAKMCKIPIYTICPVDSHYRKERWIHPFIYELSDKIFDSNEKLVYYLNQMNKLGKLIIRRDINVNKVIDYLNSFDGGYNEGYLVTKKFWGEKPARLVKKAANLLKEKGIKGASCLDLGCGHGKNAIFLAELGFEVNAIDSSYLCIQEAKALSDLVKWKVRDIRKVQCENEKYDLVLLTGSLHCLTTKDEVEKVIETVKISTKVGGYNVISVFNDELQDLSGHSPDFHPLLLNHKEYEQFYADWKILESTNTLLEDEHPHNHIKHYHSITRLLVERIM